MTPLSGKSDSDPALRIVDALGHDLPGATSRAVRQMIEWLELEQEHGDPLSPDLADLLRRLQEQEAKDASG